MQMHQNWLLPKASVCTASMSEWGGWVELLTKPEGEPLVHVVMGVLLLETVVDRGSVWSSFSIAIGVEQSVLIDGEFEMSTASIRTAALVWE